MKDSFRARSLSLHKYLIDKLVVYREYGARATAHKYLLNAFVLFYVSSSSIHFFFFSSKINMRESKRNRNQGRKRERGRRREIAIGMNEFEWKISSDRAGFHAYKRKHLPGIRHTYTTSIQFIFNDFHLLTINRLWLFNFPYAKKEAETATAKQHY